MSADMADTNDDTAAARLDPKAIAHAVALETADEPEQVGDFAEAIDLGDGVTDFRFAAVIRGYEGWQWSVTLFHDIEVDAWTVNESSLIPTDAALRPPEWVPWKDRLEPTDLSPTDSIGTEPDDPRLEEGELAESSLPDVEEAREAFDLSRRRVLSPLGRAQAAKRWYEGPRGPKALSTKTASGNPCSTCGFFVPLAGELDRMFGVCANKWSPDDGRVVSLDHGCGEHSEIEPPEPSHLWVQSKPAYDDMHIDVVVQSPREERGQVELLEEIVTDAKDVDETDDASEQDIEAVAEPEASDEEIATETVPEGEGPEVEVTVELTEPAADDDNDSAETESGETEPMESAESAEDIESDESVENASEESVEPAESDSAEPDDAEK